MHIAFKCYPDCALRLYFSFIMALCSLSCGSLCTMLVEVHCQVFRNFFLWMFSAAHIYRLYNHTRSLHVHEKSYIGTSLLANTLAIGGRHMLRTIHLQITFREQRYFGFHHSKWTELWQVTVGKAQIYIITLMMAKFHSPVSVSFWPWYFSHCFGLLGHLN